MLKQIKITLKKSCIGQLEKNKRTVQALGLKKVGSSVIKDETVAIRGMINCIKHMILVEETAGE